MNKQAKNMYARYLFSGHIRTSYKLMVKKKKKGQETKKIISKAKRIYERPITIE